jgi:phosphatidylinositol alpha-1,6-mannosyltransferase
MSLHTEQAPVSAVALGDSEALDGASSRVSPGAFPPTALASISRRGHDGVAHVARLLHLALRDLAGVAPRTVDLEPATPGVVSLRERASFAARVMLAQRPGASRFVLYSHLGIARAHLLLPGSLRRPYGIFLHGIEAWGSPLGDVQQKLLAGAAVLVSNSHFTADRVMTLYPSVGRVDPCPLALLPEVPVDDGPVDAQLVARVRDRSALIVGRMSSSERYKGHDLLLDAWPSVRVLVPDAQLVVAGRGGDGGRVRGRAEAMGLGESVLFCGGVSDATLAALYRRVAMFAMPSRGEGFGIVYLEAMRAGLACVASKDDGAVDVVEDGRTGVLVAPGDVATLATVVGGLLGDPGRARALGEAGRRRYHEKFTYPHFRERLGAILMRGVAAGPRGRR